MSQNLFPRSEYKNHLAKVHHTCAFCGSPDDLTVKSYKTWIWIFAMFPYRKFHTMLIPKRHIAKFEELEASEILEMHEIFKEIESYYLKSRIVGDNSLYGDQLFFFWRSRAVVIGKESVNHLHIHLCPKFEFEQGIVLQDDAWNINIEVLKDVISITEE